MPHKYREPFCDDLKLKDKKLNIDAKIPFRTCISSDWLFISHARTLNRLSNSASGFSATYLLSNGMVHRTD
jgi:hypothetical protein